MPETRPKTTPKVLVINGPNLNLLGHRERDIYGDQTLDDIYALLTARFSNISFHFYQSNSEGELIDQLQTAIESDYIGVVLNPGAYGHYSYALRDAVAAATVPVIEVHLTNVFRREPFRAVSVIAPVCWGSIVGLGPLGYVLAVDALLEKAKVTKSAR